MRTDFSPDRDAGTLYHRVSTWVEQNAARQHAFLAKLVRTPSDNPPGDCTLLAEVAAQALADLGLDVEHHPIPDHVVLEAGMRSLTNLVIRRRFGDGPVIALNAHGDVVPPGDGWSRDPYGAEVLDGWMYGRGVAVSKSDFATYAFALMALESLGASGELMPGGTVELHLTCDEETGGEIGPAWLLRNGISRPDFAVCAGFSYAVINAHNGCLHLEITVRGRQAHAAMPESGVDALEAATAILNALYRYRRELGSRHSGIEGIGSPQLNVGLIEGGINTNVVPDRVRLRLDRRIIPEEDPEAVEAELRSVIADAITVHAIELEVRRIMLARPFGPVPGSDRLAATVARHASQVFGEPIPVRGVPLYTDARHYTEAGVPTVIYGAGPRSILEANAHGADERLRLADLERATVVMTLVLADLVGSGLPNAGADSG